MSQSEIAMTLKIEAGKKYRTRGGDEVEVLRTDLNSDTPVAGIVTNRDGTQSLCEWHASGRFWGDGPNDDRDLISEVKPKRVVWLNVYYDGSANAFSSKEKADASCFKDVRLACIRVEFEEGRFDE